MEISRCHAVGNGATGLYRGCRAVECDYPVINVKVEGVGAAGNCIRAYVFQDIVKHDLISDMHRTWLVGDRGNDDVQTTGGGQW